MGSDADADDSADDTGGNGDNSAAVGNSDDGTAARRRQRPFAVTFTLVSASFLASTYAGLSAFTAVLDRSGWLGVVAITVTVVGVAWLLVLMSDRPRWTRGRWVGGAAVTVLGLVGSVVFAHTVLVPQPDAEVGETGRGAALAVAAQPFADQCQTGWFVPRTPAELGSLRLEPDQYWTDSPAVADGAFADAGTQLVTVQGTSDTSVTLTGMVVDVLDRRPPPAGTVLRGVCGGPAGLRWVDVDLDQPRPTVSSAPLGEFAVRAAKERAQRIEPVRFPYEISEHDSETFAINAHTENCDCSWVARFRWASGGKTGELTVTDNGKPFRTISGKQAARCGVDVTTGRVSCP